MAPLFAFGIDGPLQAKAAPILKLAPRAQAVGVALLN